MPQWQWCSQDLSTGAKARERSDLVGGGCGIEGLSPSHSREIFCCWKFVYENEISCTLNAIIRGLVMWSDIYQPPTPPSLNKNIQSYSNQGDEGMGRVLLVTVCQWRWCSQVLSTGCQSEGAKRPRGGRVWEGVPPSHVREICCCWKFVYENGIFFIRGKLCEVA